MLKSNHMIIELKGKELKPRFYDEWLLWLFQSEYSMRLKAINKLMKDRVFKYYNANDNYSH